MTICIIPARSGSKRVPLKNIKDFCGKPIIAYSIEAAIKSKLFDRIIVSTDSKNIADIAIKYGAQVPFLRPAYLADDVTGTIPVIKQTLEELEKQIKDITYVCCLYATAPFVRPKYIIEGMNRLIESNSPYCISVTSFPYPIQRALRRNSVNQIEMVWPENEQKRSQDLEECWHDAAQFYWGKKESFLNEVPFFTSNASAVYLPRYLVQDIDTIEDWDRAEYMFKAQTKPI